MSKSADQFSGVFICYRREDTAGHAGRLYDHLSAHFGVNQIFMDIDQIEPGEDFVQVIEVAVSSCKVLLALIGRDWLTSSDGYGRRLDNPNDFVRLEIAAALGSQIRVIPVLVQRAKMPRQQDLPEDLLQLTRRHAVELSDIRWKHDVSQLINTVERVLARKREADNDASREETEQRRHAENSGRLNQKVKPISRGFHTGFKVPSELQPKPGETSEQKIARLKRLVEEAKRAAGKL